MCVLFFWLHLNGHLRRLALAKRQKLGSPRMEPQLGSEPDDVEVLDDLERVLGGDGGVLNPFSGLSSATLKVKSQNETDKKRRQYRCCGKLNTS